MLDGSSKLDVRSQIAVGSVLRGLFDQQDGVTPKDGMTKREKIFIIIGETEDGNLLGLLLINSKARYGKEIDDLQYPLSSTKYPEFLNHESFVDCSNLHRRDFDDVAIYAEDYKDKICGILDEDDLDQIREIVKNASTIRPITKKKFGLI